MSDANDPVISESGVFFDSVANRVVDAPPVEGVQIVAPGAEVTPAVQVVIDRYQEGAAVEVAVDQTDVETATVKAPRGKRGG